MANLATGVGESIRVGPGASLLSYKNRRAAGPYLFIAPAMALLAAMLTGGLPLLAAYTQIFMTNTGDFIIAFFPLFMLGAIFGKLMDDSGSAKAIAKAVIAWLGPARAIVAVVLCCGLLTYGGVSLFVVAFAIFPVAAALFRDADIPKRLIPGTLALGSFTFTSRSGQDQASSVSAIRAPAFSYRASEKPLPAPAPASTQTS